MNDLSNTTQSKHNPALARFYHWVKQRQAGMTSSWMNKTDSDNKTNPTEEYYVTSYSQRI